MAKSIILEKFGTTAVTGLGFMAQKVGFDVQVLRQGQVHEADYFKIQQFYTINEKYAE